MSSKVIKIELFFNRFCSSLKSFKDLKEGHRIIVSVSGGVDSVTLLKLLIQFNEFELLVAHINHNLRIESHDEELFVKKICQNNHIDFHTITLNPKNRNKKYSVEEWARNERNDFLQNILNKTDSDYIMTGHHGNDQVETILMNLSRKSGLLGLRGIARHREKYLRPMLEFTKKEIIDYAEHFGYNYLNDKSNLDNTIPRNFIRNKVITLWQHEMPNLVSAFTNSADYIKQWQVGTDFLINNFLIGSLKVSKTVFNVPMTIIESFPKIIIIRFFQLIIKSNHHQWSKHQLNMLIQFIDKSNTGDFHILNNQWRLLRDRDFIKVFKKKSKVVHDNIDIFLGTPVIHNNYRYEINLAKNKLSEVRNNDLESIDWNKLKSKKLEIRLWREGDVFQPLGMEGHQKISDFLINEKVNRIEKESQSVITADGTIFWVCGRRIANWVRITNRTQKIASLHRSYMKQ